MLLKGKMALITGASTGIGRAIAIELAKEGATVVLTARSIDGLNKTLELVKGVGGKGEIIPIDLRDIKAIQNLAKKIKEKWSKLDILINVAGIWHSKDKAYYDIDFEDYSIGEILETFDVGLTAPTMLSHELIPLMKKGSHIINISGTFENGAKGWLPYYVSKKGIEELTYGLAQELNDKDIFVNGISPSDTATEQYSKYFPQYISEAINPEEVAKLALNIISSEKTGTIQVIKKYNYSNKDVEFTKQAIEMANKSYEDGAFPAGAVLVKNGKVIAKNISAKWPQIIFHAESKTIDEAMSKFNEQLTDCILYCSMEPCLMCLSRAYWSGIRKIFYAIKKESVPYKTCYESNHSHNELLEKFNVKIETIHIKELENKALELVRKWEMKQK
jgi:NAD(P)-dependent dehydrogenase (short-subunit alcohol dehydrogenase family)/tRNA(Arg) A34 adenosine deaminase TadA